MKHVLPFLLLLWPAALASEEAEPIVATDKPGSVALTMRLEGYLARTVDDDGTPVIESGVGGTNFSIRFFGCTDNKDCSAAMLIASFDTPKGISLETVNAWNETEVFGRAYVDSECDAYFEHVIIGDPEMGQEVFLRILDHWDHYLHAFRRHIRFDDEDTADMSLETCEGASQAL